MSALDEARSFFEGTPERPLDYTEALAWDLLEQLEATEKARQLLIQENDQMGQEIDRLREGDAV